MICMNINQLKYLLTVAEEMSFSKAAQKLFISQPSLSQSIQLLEKEYGVQFFTRKPLRLTYAGEIFIDWAKKVLASEAQVEQRISDIAVNKEVKLVVGMSPYRSTYLLPPVITKFREEFPQCKLLLEEHPSDMLQTFLDDGKVDLLIDIPNPDTYLYKSHIISEEKILLAVPASWNFEIKKESFYPEISLLQLRDRPFVFLTKNQQIGKISRNLCMQCGLEPKVVLECHNIETAYSMILAGIGASFIPELFVQHYIKDNLKNVKFFEIKDFYPKREIAVVYSREKYLTKAAKRFVELLKDTINSGENK